LVVVVVVLTLTRVAFSLCLSFLLNTAAVWSLPVVLMMTSASP
jgi:hypothetical protein